MLTVLIVGDSVFRPGPFKQRIEAAIPGKLDIRTLEFTFDQPEFAIDMAKPLPTGMIMGDPAKAGDHLDCGVKEFYAAPDALSSKLAGVDVLIIHGAALPGPVIEEAKDLKAVISMRGGPVNLDVDSLKSRGIPLYQTNGKNAPAVAEFVLGAIIDFERGISKGNALLKNGRWYIRSIDPLVGHELRGKTFGLVGYGKIGRSFRELLSGFSARVLAYDPYVDAAELRRDRVEPMELDELVAAADYVSLHARAEKGAPPLMDAARIDRMHRGAVLVNSARGPLVDHAALKQALAAGKIRGAILDVVGNDAFGFYQDLVSRDDALVTPHIAAASRETVERGYAMAVEILKKIAPDGAL